MSCLCSLIPDCRSTLRTLLLRNLCLLRLALHCLLAIVLLFGFSLRTRVFPPLPLTVLITLFHISIVLVVDLLVLPAYQLLSLLLWRYGRHGAYLVKVLQDLLVRFSPGHPILIPFLVVVVLILIVIAVLLLVLVVKLFIV
jgi:hypothetical protein